MRLHSALEHIQAGHFRSLETWAEGEVERLVQTILTNSAATIEFTLEDLDAAEKADTIQTFIDFADELWNAEIAPIPHDIFWVSWSQKVLDVTVRMAAFCERVTSQIDGSFTCLSIRVMFENQWRSGLAFVNETGFLVRGDHKEVLVSGVNTDTAGLLTDNGFGIVKLVLGALATPQAIKSRVEAPEKLNRQRARKLKEPIGPLIVIDVRARHIAARRSGTSGGGFRTVKPHWRRGHIRRLPSGKLTNIPPVCVNMESVVPVKPEYLIRT